MPDAGGTTARELGRVVEGRGAWVAARVTLALLSISYGSPLLIVIGLKPIAADLGTQRQVDFARGGADLGRHRARRHPDGLGRRPHRRARAR